MFNIADYFKKFVKIEGDTNLQRNTISYALQKVCNIEKPEFDVKKNILYIKGSPMVKSAVFLKKSFILASVKESMPQSRIMDIR
jgi:hypothetical protein